MFPVGEGPEPEFMTKYRVAVHGRHIGAIGIMYTETIVVWARSARELEAKLYDTHEHITSWRIVEVCS